MPLTCFAIDRWEDKKKNDNQQDQKQINAAKRLNLLLRAYTLVKEIYNNDNNNSNNDNDKVSENIRNAWKSQAWLDTQQVSKRQIQLKHKRRQVNLC